MQSLIQSKRFWVSIAGLAVILLGDKLPFNEQQITDIVMVIGAWIVGDSLRQTDPKKP